MPSNTSDPSKAPGLKYASERVALGRQVEVELANNGAGSEGRSLRADNHSQRGEHVQPMRGDCMNITCHVVYNYYSFDLLHEL